MGDEKERTLPAELEVRKKRGGEDVYGGVYRTSVEDDLLLAALIEHHPERDPVNLKK